MKQDGSDQNKEGGAAATTPQEQSKAPAKAQNKAPSDSVGQLIERIKPSIERALPAHMTPDRMARMALTALRNNEKLQKADPYTLMGSIVTAAQLGLEPNTPLGHAYIIPYYNKRDSKYEANFQLGYKGLVDLAQRSGKYRRIVARAVDEADTFDFEYGLDERLEHKPARQPSGKTVWYYALYELDNGGREFVVWSREQVAEHAHKYSKSYGKDDSPWTTAFDQMAKKTVLIDLLRYAPKSVEVADFIERDNRTLRATENPEVPVEAEEADFSLKAEPAEQ
jgi:recombination protein RecT